MKEKYDWHRTRPQPRTVEQGEEVDRYPGLKPGMWVRQQRGGNISGAVGKGTDREMDVDTGKELGLVIGTSGGFGTSSIAVRVGEQTVYCTPWSLEIAEDKSPGAAQFHLASMEASRRISEASGFKEYWAKVEAGMEEQRLARLAELETRIADRLALPKQSELEEFYKLKYEGKRWNYTRLELSRGTIWRDLLNGRHEILTQEYLESLSDYLMDRVETLHAELGRPVVIAELLSDNEFFKTHLVPMLEEKLPTGTADLHFGPSRGTVEDSLSEHQADIVIWDWPPDVHQTEEDILTPILQSEVSELVFIGHRGSYDPVRYPFGYPIVRQIGPGSSNERSYDYPPEQKYSNRLAAAGWTNSTGRTVWDQNTGENLAASEEPLVQAMIDCQKYPFYGYEFERGKRSETVCYRRPETDR